MCLPILPNYSINMCLIVFATLLWSGSHGEAGKVEVTGEVTVVDEVPPSPPPVGGGPP